MIDLSKCNSWQYLSIKIINVILASWEFYCLETEITEANKFADLIFEYIKNDKKIYYLLQIKHKSDESKKIIAHDLLIEKTDLLIII